MSTEQKLERRLARFEMISKLQQEWRELFPNLESPPWAQFALWLRLHGYDAATVLAGLQEAARKNKLIGGKMDFDFALRYASSAMNFIKARTTANRPRLPEKCYADAEQTISQEKAA